MRRGGGRGLVLALGAGALLLLVGAGAARRRRRRRGKSKLLPARRADTPHGAVDTGGSSAWQKALGFLDASEPRSLVAMWISTAPIG